MTLNCEILRELISTFSLVHDCYALEDGTLRIATAFQYPDGSLIDLFIKPESAPPEDQASYLRGFLLSDFGQTMTYLMDMGVRPSSGARKSRIVDDICASTGVDYMRGELQAWVAPDDTDELAQQVKQLILACIRVADLSFFQKYEVPNSFKEEVKHFVGSDRTKGPPVKLTGRWGREVEIDFEVTGKRAKSFLKTISTGGRAAPVHPYLTEAFSRWYDLKPLHEKNQFVTVIDDKEGTTRSDDLNRLKDISHVVYFPREREKLNEIISAA